MLAKIRAQSPRTLPERVSRPLGTLAEFLGLLRRQADVVDDPAAAPVLHSPDPGDDYLIALAALARAVIVSGDGHLLGMVDDLPVHSPADFLPLLGLSRH